MSPEEPSRPGGPRVPRVHGAPSPSTVRGKTEGGVEGLDKDSLSAPVVFGAASAPAAFDAVSAPAALDAVSASDLEASKVHESEQSDLESQAPDAPAVEPLQDRDLDEPSEVPSPAESEVEEPITDAEFEAWVEEAIERIPEQFLAELENVAFMVEHDSPAGGHTLLGLYHGVPLTGRGYYAGAMPDTITIYQNPMIRVYRKRERVREEVYRTVVHEIGHYFGFDDDELHELGW